MCGIVGFVNYKNDLQNKNEIISKMINSIAKRGPDEEGIYVNEYIALGHKRLIVIDKERWKTTYGRKILYWRICNNL